MWAPTGGEYRLAGRFVQITQGMVSIDIGESASALVALSRLRPEDQTYVRGELAKVDLRMQCNALSDDDLAIPLIAAPTPTVIVSDAGVPLIPDGPPIKLSAVAPPLALSPPVKPTSRPQPLRAVKFAAASAYIDSPATPLSLFHVDAPRGRVWLGVVDLCVRPKLLQLLNCVVAGGFVRIELQRSILTPID